MRVSSRGRLRPRYAGAIAVAGIAVVAALSSPALGVRTTAAYPLSRSVRLRTVRLERGPQEIRILKLRQAAVPDLQTADTHFPLRKRTSAMSVDAGALAGINGDFGTDDGLPVHMLMIDGELWTTGIMAGNAIAPIALAFAVLDLRLGDGGDARRRREVLAQGLQPWVGGLLVARGRLGAIRGFLDETLRAHNDFDLVGLRRAIAVGVLHV